MALGHHLQLAPTRREGDMMLRGQVPLAGKDQNEMVQKSLPHIDHGFCVDGLPQIDVLDRRAKRACQPPNLERRFRFCKHHNASGESFDGSVTPRGWPRHRAIPVSGALHSTGTSRLWSHGCLSPLLQWGLLFIDTSPNPVQS